MWRSLIAVFVGLLFHGCSLSDPDGIAIYGDYYDFNDGMQGWKVDFADYPTGEEDSIGYELQFSYTNLPEDLSSLKGIMMSGNNHSDDLFMFMKKKISGLPAHTLFTIVFEVEIASNVASGQMGAGGAPGESVFIKAGASNTEPKKVIDEGRYVLNIDKGNQLEGGEDVITLGTIAVAPNTTKYTLITRSNMNTSQRFVAKTNDKGELWLIVGTDSGFEGVTTVYYTKLNFVFSATY